MVYKHLSLSKVQSILQRTMHPKWLKNKTTKHIQHKVLQRWAPSKRLEEKLLWMHRERETSPFMRLSQCSRKAALWLPALWISTPASLFITSTQSPYLPSTALDYREGTLSREPDKANEHRVKPELQQWDTTQRAAQQWGWVSSTYVHLYLFSPLSHKFLLLWNYDLPAWSQNI